MNVLRREISVAYPLQVFFTEGVFDPENEVLSEVLAGEDHPFRKKVLVVVDEALAQANPGLNGRIEDWFGRPGRGFQLVCPPLVHEGGERIKNSYFHVSEIQSQMERFRIDRHSYLVALGGGALLDMAGLAAATAHRGVRHVRLPTTTLSQADSGVGVKNGINAFGKKNFIGTFAPPFAVINDFQLLGTLSDRDKRGGYIEAVKVALIRDREFFEWIEREASALARFETDAMRRLIRRSAELHLDHITTSGDPFEMGSARPLDFGHWAAHKLEQLSDYRLRHGEAVAIGLAVDVLYCAKMGYLESAAADRILDLIDRLGFVSFSPELLRVDSGGALVLLEGLEEFREHLGGQLTITLLREIGHGFEIHEINPSKMVESFHTLKERHEARSGKRGESSD